MQCVGCEERYARRTRQRSHFVIYSTSHAIEAVVFTQARPSRRDSWPPLRQGRETRAFLLLSVLTHDPTQVRPHNTDLDAPERVPNNYSLPYGYSSIGVRVMSCGIHMPRLIQRSRASSRGANAIRMHSSPGHSFHGQLGSVSTCMNCNLQVQLHVKYYGPGESVLRRDEW